jgi:hypothetical protein
MATNFPGQHGPLPQGPSRLAACLAGAIEAERPVVAFDWVLKSPRYCESVLGDMLSISSVVVVLILFHLVCPTDSCLCEYASQAAWSIPKLMTRKAVRISL